MKRTVLLFSFFALFMTGFLVVGTQHAIAATWCAVMANPTSPNGTTSANCINGQNYTALNGLGGPGTASATLKTNFRNYINSKSASGYGFQKIGAAFIKNGLDGGAGDWSTRINNPAVTFSMENFNSCGTPWPNTAFSIVSNSVVNDPSCKLATPALVIRASGVIKYAIKVDCGNPMGNLSALPSFDWTLTGTSSVSATTAKVNTSVTFKHTVKNSGPNTAAYGWLIQRNYAGTGWVNLTGTVNVSTVKNGINPNPYSYNFTIPAGAAIGTTYCQRVYFTNATGPATAAGISAAKCVTVVATPVPSLGCPNLPGVNGAAIGGVSFPTAEPNDPVPSSPSNGTKYYARPVIGHALVRARDAYTGMNLGVNSAALTVDFTNAIKAYPYDSQLANVTYTNTYQLYSYTWVVTYTNIYNAKTKKWVLTPTGGYWVTGGGSTYVSAQHSDGQTGMGECYRRGFTVTSVSPGNVTLLPDNEDPTQASAGGASATVAFDYNGGPTPTGGMRTPMSIQLNYSWQFDNGCSGSGSFTVTGGYGAGNATGFIPASPSCPASAPPLAAGDVVCITYTVDPATGEMTSNGIPIGGSGSVDSGQACSQAVTNMPYAHFFGLDVSAGGNFATGSDKCLGSTPAPSGIVAFVKGIGPLVRGSAVQYGALALGPVNSFGSASLRPAIPTSRDGLTFANQGPLGSLGTTHCVPDYFSTIPATLTQSSSDVNMAPFDGVGVPATPQQFWYGRAGRTTIKGFPGAGQGINKGNRIAIYVSGDVFIKDDIKFKQTSWTTSDVVPSFYLIVKGNIFISPNVSQLDGVYVAQNGTINTCAPSVGVYLPSEVYDNCTNQLTVNGAFVAKNVNLYRTFASLRNSQGGESPLGPLGPDNCTINGARSTTYDCAAEIFNFSPETFLSKPALGRSANVGGIKYDFITSLSPVL
ncbi:MAG: hypothetical protein ABI602_03580 [Candidatus Saccharibacteria bacterium]